MAIDDQTRALKIAFEHHRIMPGKTSLFCSCGEAGTIWPNDSYKGWAFGPGKHINDKAEEILKAISKAN